MKKIFALLLCLALSFCFFACDGEKNDTENEGNYNKANSINFYVNCEGNVKVELGANASEIRSKLGTPTAESEMGACGDQGTVTKYSYASIDLYALKNSDKETVDQITLKNDLISTPEGIKIGSSKDDVIKAYGEGYSKCDENEIRYTSGNKNLKFQLRDDCVVGVDYMVLG